MKTIVVVGNGDVNGDYSELVDSADFVVRFNEARNYNKNSGIKADALCLTNTGSSARRFAKNKSIVNLPFIESVAQIWFPRPVNFRPIQFWLKPLNKVTYRHADYAKHIVARNELSHKKIIYFSEELYATACEELAITQSSFHMPSSGYLGLKYVLHQFTAPEVKITLIGFGFSGIELHAWENERKAITKLHDVNMIHLLS